MSTDPFVAPVPEAEPRNEPTLAPGLRLPPAQGQGQGQGHGQSQVHPSLP